MSRPNYIDFVEHLYRFKPDFADSRIMAILLVAFGVVVKYSTLSVWKAKLRKKGINIPDRRKTNATRKN